MLTNKLEINLGIRLIGYSVNFNLHPFNKDKKKWSPYVGIHSNSAHYLSGLTVLYLPVGIQYKTTSGWFFSIDAGPLAGVKDKFMGSTDEGITVAGGLKIGYRFKHKKRNRRPKAPSSLHQRFGLSLTGGPYLFDKLIPYGCALNAQLHPIIELELELKGLGLGAGTYLYPFYKKNTKLKPYIGLHATSFTAPQKQQAGHFIYLLTGIKWMATKRIFVNLEGGLTYGRGATIGEEKDSFNNVYKSLFYKDYKNAIGVRLKVGSYF